MERASIAGCVVETTADILRFVVRVVGPESVLFVKAAFWASLALPLGLHAVAVLLLGLRPPSQAWTAAAHCGLSLVSHIPDRRTSGSGLAQIRSSRRGPFDRAALVFAVARPPRW